MGNAIGQRPGGRTRCENEPVQRPDSRMRSWPVVYLLGRIGLLKINDSRADVNMIDFRVPMRAGFAWVYTVGYAATGASALFLPLVRQGEFL